MIHFRNWKGRNIVILRVKVGVGLEHLFPVALGQFQSNHSVQEDLPML